MSDLLEYFAAQEKTRSMRNLHSYADMAITVAEINERLAEIKSQHEPLNKLLETAMTERERLYATAFYVVVGRMPKDS